MSSRTKQKLNGVAAHITSDALHMPSSHAISSPHTLSTNHHIPTATLALTPHSANTTGSMMGQGSKFIHLNNTNLFVLMDGVSMFFEGKSTFTGENDPLLLQQVSNHKRRKNVNKSKLVNNAL